MIHPDDDAESRLLQLENIEAIRRLKCAFAERLDRMVNEAGPAQPVLDCFAETATWDSEHFGSYTGHSGLATMLRAYTEKLSFCLNFMLNHAITVDVFGKTAVGRWTTWSPMTVDGQPLILAGHYADTYGLIGDAWKITSVRLRTKFIADYRKGWAQDRIATSWTWPPSPEKETCGAP